PGSVHPHSRACCWRCSCLAASGWHSSHPLGRRYGWRLWPTHVSDIGRSNQRSSCSHPALQINAHHFTHRPRRYWRSCSSVLIDPAGQVVWTYDKTHPTPGPESAFTLPGAGVVPITETPFGRIASVICFDMDFPRLVRQVGQAHADLLIAPSLDWDTAKYSH